jgi:quinoprotein relay system zinc metallohydrolase 2
MAHDSPGITRVKRPWFPLFAGVRLAAMVLLLACILNIPWDGPARALESGQDATPILSLEEIVPGVYVSQGRYEIASPDNRGQISNIGFIVGGEAVAIIDTGGSAAVGRALKAAVRRVTGLPIRYVINTHMHPDHVFGNAAFSNENVVFTGHRKLARALRSRGAHYLQSNKELIGDKAFCGTRIIFPGQAIADSLTLDLGGRELRLTAHPTAHTDNDLTVFDVQTRTLWLGDLLFARHIPVIDGSISGWLEVIKKLKTENAARVVPGHGPPSLPWPEAANAQMRYLSRLRGAVQRYIDEGRTLGDAQRDILADTSENWLLSEEYQARNVSAAFTSLEWE